jgi:hypothetical protein
MGLEMEAAEAAYWEDPEGAESELEAYELDCAADDEAEPVHTRGHDVVMLFSGDSPHPVAIKCEDCDWNGVVQDGI